MYKTITEIATLFVKTNNPKKLSKRHIRNILRTAAMEDQIEYKRPTRWFYLNDESATKWWDSRNARTKKKKS